eukprot:m51a1_g7286 hypothetical protein (488) ;mRNA; f:40361-42150
MSTTRYSHGVCLRDSDSFATSDNARTDTRETQSVVTNKTQQQQLEEEATNKSDDLTTAPGSSAPQPQANVVERAMITWELSFEPFPSPLPVPPVCDADVDMSVAPCDPFAEDAELSQRKRPRDDNDEDDEPPHKRRLGRTVPVPVYTELPHIDSNSSASTSKPPGVPSQTTSDNAMPVAARQRTAAAIYCDTPTPPVPANGACMQFIYCDTPTPPMSTQPKGHVPVAVPTQSAQTFSSPHETQDREQAQDMPKQQEKDERDVAVAREKDADNAEADAPATTTAAAAPALQGSARAMEESSEESSDEETERPAESHESEVTHKSLIALFMDPRRRQPLTPRQETKLGALLRFNADLVAELVRNAPERAQQPAEVHELLEQATEQPFHPRALLDSVCLAAHANERELRKTVRTAVVPGDPAQTVVWPMLQRHKHSSQQLLDEGPAHGEESLEWNEDEREDSDNDYNEEVVEEQGPRATQQNAEDSESDQ